MGKSAPTPPPAPDYTGAAVAQGDANLKSSQQGAVLSNPNIYGPMGNQTVSYNNIQSPDGSWMMQPSVQQTLTPAAQGTFDAQQRVQRGLSGLGERALGTATSIIGEQFNPQNVGVQTSLPGYGQAQGTAQAPNLQTSLDTSGVAKMPVSAGTTGQQAILARLQPQMDQNNKALQQQLANQGLTAGGEAYNNAARLQGQNNNDMYSQAALQGINLDMAANSQGMQNAINSGNFGNNAQLQQFQAGLQNAGLYNSAQAQNFNQALQSGQFGNQASQQNLQQQMQLYNQPLNQIAALMSGSQIQMPQFQGYTGQNVQPAPIANATAQQGQYAQNLYGQQMAGYNSQMQGMGSMLGAGASLLAAPMTGGVSLLGMMGR